MPRKVLLLSLLLVGLCCLGIGLYSVLHKPEVISSTKASPKAETTLEVPLLSPWTNTGMQVKAGQVLKVTASGRGVWKNISDPNPNAYPRPYEECGPDGTPPVDKKDYYSNISSYPCRTANKGALIGRIGDNGLPFFVGTHFDRVVQESGSLYLGINDIAGAENWSDNSGSFNASIQVNPESKSVPTRALSIPMMGWKAATWNEYGPAIDSVQNGDYVFARAVGSISYNFAVGASVLTGSQAEISAKVSSELNHTTSTDLVFSSDVTVLVNGIEQSTQNIVPDDTIGKLCTWRVSVAAFKPDTVNELTFSVKKEAFYKNGLCIYGPIEIRFD